MTTIGSFIWCSILSWYGKGAFERNPKLMENPDEMVHAIKHESIWLVGGIALLCVLYFLVLKLTASKADTPGKSVSE
jgi:membrane protein DedA with SNARE-associated domain